MKADGMLRDFQAYGSGFTGSMAAGGFHGIEPAAFSGVHGLASFLERLFALALQFFRRAETVVRFLLLDEPLGIGAVGSHLVGLAVRRERTAHVGAFVPIQAQPFQVFKELRLVAGFAALNVGVFDPENESAALLPREQPIEQRRAHVADVQLARGRRSKAYAD